MSDEFQMQREEKPGEREEKERRRREREEWEKRIAGGLSDTASQYGARISEVASSAKDYVSDKVSVVGDKLKDLQNADLGELAEDAKDYARQKPGQALLISAAVGFLLGFIIRGRR